MLWGTCDVQVSCLILSNCGLKLQTYFPPTNQNLNTLYTLCSYVLDHQLDFHWQRVVSSSDFLYGYSNNTKKYNSYTTMSSPLYMIWQTIVQAELMIIATCLIRGFWCGNSEQHSNQQIRYNCGRSHSGLWGTHLLPSKNTSWRVSVYKLLLTSLSSRLVVHIVLSFL